jgi:hypothetical protein
MVRSDCNIWRAQGNRQEGFPAIKAETFYFGVKFRVRLCKLSDILHDYLLSGIGSAVGALANNAGTSAKLPIS